MFEKILKHFGYARNTESNYYKTETARLERELAGFIKANSKLYDEKIDLLRLNEQLTKENQELREEKDAYCHNATSQKAQIEELNREIKELKQRCNDKREQIAILDEANVKLQKELSECKTQLEKALSKPFKHAHEARHKNIKHRRKKR